MKKVDSENRNFKIEKEYFYYLQVRPEVHSVTHVSIFEQKLKYYYNEREIYGFDLTLIHGMKKT